MSCIESYELVRRRFAEFEPGDVFLRDRDSQRSCGSLRATDQTESMKVDDHLMDDRRCDLKVSLHVRFGGRSPVDLRVRVDERQVLPLQFRVRCHRADQDAGRPTLSRFRPREELESKRSRRWGEAGFSEKLAADRSDMLRNPLGEFRPRPRTSGDGENDCFLFVYRG